MKTIVIIGGIILAGATVIAVVQNDKKNAAPEVHQAGDGHDHSGMPAEAQTGGQGLNPAHGLAGHRCDLPVGAPLNTSSEAVVPTQASPNMNMSPGPQMAPAGMKVNPAHGLPGHRCDIQVGAPLT